MTSQTIEVPIAGLNSTVAVRHIERAICEVPGVYLAWVLRSSEKAIIQTESGGPNLSAIREAVVKAGYSVPEGWPSTQFASSRTASARKALVLIAAGLGAVLLILASVIDF